MEEKKMEERGWKDSTSYSKGGRGKKEPSAYMWENGRLRITVTKGHIYYKGQWIMHCHKIGLTEIDLHLSGDVVAEKAQERAINIVRSYLRDLIELTIL